MLEHKKPNHPLRRWLESFWLLIAILTPLFVNLWVEQQFESSKIWLLRTLVWVLALLWLSGGLTGLAYKPLPRPIRHLLITLGLVLLLATLFSPHPFIAVFGSLDRANGVLTQLSYFLLFVVVATQINARQSRLLLQAAIFTAVPICLFGLAQAAGWQPLPVFTDARSPLTTTLGRSNFTGAYLALLLPLTLSAAQEAPNRQRQLVYGGLVILELTVIVLTLARAAWIATIVGFGVYLWLHFAPGWSRWRQWLSGLAGGLGFGGMLLLILRQGIASGGSIAARWTIWQASLQLLWPGLWLGYGADTLERHFPSVYPPQLVYYQGRGVVVDRAHNWLLDWSLSYGIVALLILLAFLFCVLWQGWQQISHPAEEMTQGLKHAWLKGCLAAICAHLVGNLFIFDVAATAVLFWLLLAIVTAFSTKEKPAIIQIPKRIQFGKGLLLLSVLLVSWAVWLSNGKPLWADIHSWRGTQALNQGEPIKALRAYETAAALQPNRVEYQVASALTAAQLGQFEKAEKTMLNAITQQPTNHLLYTHLASVYAYWAVEAGEKIEMAYLAYDQALLLAPTIGITRQQYADLALWAGDYDLARTQAQGAVDLDATDAASFIVLGWAQLQNNNLNAAQQSFEEAVKWEPASGEAYLGLADVYFQQGKKEKAQQAVQQSLILNPNFIPALELQTSIQGLE